MNQNEYMGVLERNLGNIPQEEKKDILYDYEEHFRSGVEQGMTEDEISRSLGNPRTVARQYKAGYLVKRAENDKSVPNIIKAIIASFGLGFFNLIVALPIFAVMLSVLISFFAASISIIVSGIAVFIGVLAQPFIPWAVSLGITARVAIPVSIGLTSLGLLMLIGSIYVSRFFYRGSIKYLKFNLNIIKQ